MEKEKLLIDLDSISPNNLYNMICKHMSFNDVVEFYKYLKYKMEYLEDKPYMDMGEISTAGYFREVTDGGNKILG